MPAPRRPIQSAHRDGDVRKERTPVVQREAQPARLIDRLAAAGLHSDERLSGAIRSQQWARRSAATAAHATSAGHALRHAVVIDAVAVDNAHLVVWESVLVARLVGRSCGAGWQAWQLTHPCMPCTGDFAAAPTHSHAVHTQIHTYAVDTLSPHMPGVQALT
eukprot:362295-Chlamydomonas_euryale.AAC.2